MDILKTLKQLKAIAPNEHYTQISKRAILSTPKKAHLTPWQFMLQAMQSGAALTLTGILFILLFGGVSAWKWISPSFDIASLDPKTLHAEAQAIDIQIQLANLSYTEPSSTAATTNAGVVTTTPSIPQKIVVGQTTLTPEVKKQAQDLGLTLPQATSSQEAQPPVGVDEALDTLAQ
jgi:hypothetical protein